MKRSGRLRTFDLRDRRTNDGFMLDRGIDRTSTGRNKRSVRQGALLNPTSRCRSARTLLVLVRYDRIAAHSRLVLESALARRRRGRTALPAILRRLSRNVGEKANMIVCTELLAAVIAPQLPVGSRKT